MIKLVEKAIFVLNELVWTKNAITNNETDSINICGQESPDPAYNV